MSRKHPIIAVTGSSGAGTSTVMKSFQHIFRRDGIRAGVIEGDAFHRYDRLGMREAMRAAHASGNINFSHFGPEANLLVELERSFASYAESGQCTTRKYLHNAEEAAPYKKPPGTFTGWEELEDATDLLFY
ncbi:MAG: phosphoribulokinase, partial [Oceanococcaceae bacterium]